MSNLFFRNPRLTVLTIALIFVGGASSFYVLPRMEDPLMTERVAVVTTQFPGADAERVESLVTENLEEVLQEFDQIKELRSVSRSGLSRLTIELRDDIYDVDPVWSRIRSKIEDAEPDLPSGALDPVFDQMDMKAYALIVALVWDDQMQGSSDEAVAANYAILRRLAEQLDDRLLAVPGTEEIDTFGDPDEEIIVEVDAAKLSNLGLTAEQLSQRVQASDAKVSAGLLRADSELLLEVGGELDSLHRISEIPIQAGQYGNFVRLADVSRVHKGIREPPSSLTLVSGRPAISLAVYVRPSVRLDHWTERADEVLTQFATALPRGVTLETVFEQHHYVDTRLAGLLRNLCLGGVAVVAVILFMMGWRSAIIVGSALPLAALMVLTGMRLLEIPIHQMSVTGLIIALGLLIDNAIVVVDEVNVRLRRGEASGVAVAQSVQHLALPLFGSTVTTALAFAPIALMPGPAGEFVGSIAVSVILAIFSSLFLALTIIPAMTAFGRAITRPVRPAVWRRPSVETENGRLLPSPKPTGGWWQDGVRSATTLRLYRSVLQRIFAKPLTGIAIGVALPIAGFVVFTTLPEQFFPPADRDQFQIELELPATSSLNETLATVNRMREEILAYEDVEAVTWFLGRSAPPFYYNVVPRRENTSNYAQALVQLKPGIQPLSIVRRLQLQLDRSFAESRVLVRQLEQGPPFDAPVEVRLFGPDLQVLRELGDRLRLTLSTVDNVVHTRADLADTVPKVSFDVDEEQARLVGLDHAMIASQLNATLEGAVGGSVLEETEELPVRVRVANQQRATLDEIASLEIVPPASTGGGSMSTVAVPTAGVPVSALASLSVVPESASIPRFNQRRMNEIQAYVTAGVLPATVLTEFQQRLAESDFVLPPGYSMEWGGEAAKRDDAVGNLMVNVGILAVLMVATLVLSFESFRVAGIIGAVAALSAGVGLGALWISGYPFGFMAIVGSMGLIGVAINDTIVVLAAVRADEEARRGDRAAMLNVIVASTRHVVATSLTTIAGFTPLLLGGDGFWPPLAVVIAGGVGGATILALIFAPSAYLMLLCPKQREASLPHPIVQHPQRKASLLTPEPAEAR